MSLNSAVPLDQDVSTSIQHIYVGSVNPLLKRWGRLKAKANLDHPLLYGIGLSLSEITPLPNCRRLGAGGMGQVFLAEDRKLGRKVAIKMLSDRWAGEAQGRQRLIHEVKAAAALDHSIEICNTESALVVELEVRCFDDECVAFPMTTRIAGPLSDV